MNCRRCQGCMARDHIVDLMESGGEWWTATWRCINCGYVLDPVVEQNRRRQQAERLASPAPCNLLQDQVSKESAEELDVAA